MPTKCFSDESGIKVGEDAPGGPKQVLSSLPQGAYTSCRTIGGWSSGKILMFDFHIRRLEGSLHWLFPSIDFSTVKIDESGVAPEQTVQGTHPNIGSVVHEEVHIYFAGENDSAGLNAAEEAAKLVRDCVGVGSLVNMRGASVDAIFSLAKSKLSRRTYSVFILECDGDGQATFGAAKLLRLLAKESQGEGAQARLADSHVMVLGIAKSNCSFSSASLGDGKYAAATKLDKTLEKLGASRIAPVKCIDAEMEDFRGEIKPWALALRTAMDTRATTSLSEVLHRVVAARISAALKGGADADGSNAEEAMVVVVCYPVQLDSGGAEVRVAVLASLLPSPAPSATVEALGGPRSVPRAKDSLWASQRAPIEAAMSPGTSEALLTDADGKAILEGLITNLFAIDADGTLLTAGEGVLVGHMRALVVDVCLQNALPLRLDSPRLADMGRWQGAFLCSTTRPIQPITAIRCPQLPGAPSRTFDDLAPVHKLKAMLAEAVPGLISA